MRKLLDRVFGFTALGQVFDRVKDNPDEFSIMISPKDYFWYSWVEYRARLYADKLGYDHHSTVHDIYKSTGGRVSEYAGNLITFERKKTIYKIASRTAQEISDGIQKTFALRKVREIDKIISRLSKQGKVSYRKKELYRAEVVLYYKTRGFFVQEKGGYTTIYWGEGINDQKDQSN